MANLGHRRRLVERYEVVRRHHCVPRRKRREWRVRVQGVPQGETCSSRGIAIGNPARKPAHILAPPLRTPGDDGPARVRRSHPRRDHRAKVLLGPGRLLGDERAQQAVDVGPYPTQRVPTNVVLWRSKRRRIERDRITHPRMIAAVTSIGLPVEPGREVVAIGRSGRTAVMQLILRTAIIRVLALIGTAILGRILLPEDFGTFAVVTFLVNLVGPLADFGLGAALIQQRERPTEPEQATVFTLQLGVALGLTAIIWLLAPLARQVAPSLPADIDWMIRVAALMLPLIAIRALPGAMMSRVLRFGPLAAIEVVQTLVYLVTSIVLALSGFGAWSFILAVVGHTLAGAILVNLAWGGRLRLSFDRTVARRMIGFGLPFQATGLLISAREALVPVFGGLAGGLAAIGYLNFGFRLGRLAGSVDEVIGRVAFPAFSRLQGDQARLNRALTWTLESTALMIAGLLAWTIAVAPTLVPLVFSERWRPAVEVFQLISLATFALVPGNFVRGLAFAAGRGRSMFYWSAATIGLLAIMLPLFLIVFGIPGGGIAFVIYSFAQLLGYVYAARHEVVFPWLRMLRIYGLAAIAALAAAFVNTAVAAALANTELSGLAGLVMSGIGFVALFGGLLVAFERDQLRRAWQLVRGDMSFREIDG